jgi:hypothetical protein
MRKILVLAAAAALTTLAGAASAETVAAAAAPALELKVGRLVVSSDGRTVGRIDRVEASKIGLIGDGRYLYIPTSTLSAGEKNRVVTSLTAKQVFAGR